MRLIWLHLKARVTGFDDEYARFDLYVEYCRETKGTTVELLRKGALLKRPFFDLLMHRAPMEAENIVYPREQVQHDPLLGVGCNVKRVMGQRVHFHMHFAFSLTGVWHKIESTLRDLTLDLDVFEELTTRLYAQTRFNWQSLIADLDEVIQTGENDVIEFKIDLFNSKEKVLKAVTAFANSGDGNLYVGISDDKQIIGIDQEIEAVGGEDEYLQWVSNLLRSRVDPIPDPFPKFSLHSIEGKRILHVFVEGGNHLYCVKMDNDRKRVAIRLGNESNWLDDPHQVAELYIRRRLGTDLGKRLGLLTS